MFLYIFVDKVETLTITGCHNAHEIIYMRFLRRVYVAYGNCLYGMLIYEHINDLVCIFRNTFLKFSVFKKCALRIY